MRFLPIILAAALAVACVKNAEAQVQTEAQKLTAARIRVYANQVAAAGTGDILRNLTETQLELNDLPTIFDGIATKV